MERGKIYNRGRASQQIDYSGLTMGKITPTDLDGLIEYQNKCFILFEYKVEGTQMPLGQSLALTRLIDALNLSKPSILILATHNHPTTEDIDAAEALVGGVYGSKGWMEKKIWENKTIKQIVNKFLRYVEK